MWGTAGVHFCTSVVSDLRNDMLQAVASNLLYTDNSCILYQHMDVVQMEKRLNKDFQNLEWFVDNKLSIHFGDDKTKSLLFTSKRKARNIRQLNIKYKDKYKIPSGSQWH